MLPRWDICLSPIFSTSPMICPFTLLVIERQRLADSIQSGCRLSCILQVQRVWVVQIVLPLIGTQHWVRNVPLSEWWKRLGRWLRANLVKNHPDSDADLEMDHDMDSDSDVDMPPQEPLPVWVNSITLSRIIRPRPGIELKWPRVGGHSTCRCKGKF